MTRNSRATILRMLTGLLVSCTFAPSVAGAAENILDAAGVRGGLVVCIGCDNPEDLVALRRGDAYLVQGLDKDPAAVANARKRIHARKLYGPVSAESFNGKHLPYAANVVNLVLVSDAFEVENAEILRVLVPGGTAYVREGNHWRKIVKPRPSGGYEVPTLEPCCPPRREFFPVKPVGPVPELTCPRPDQAGVVGRRAVQFGGPPHRARAPATLSCVCAASLVAVEEGGGLRFGPATACG